MAPSRRFGLRLISGRDSQDETDFLLVAERPGAFFRPTRDFYRVIPEADRRQGEPDFHRPFHGIPFAGQRFPDRGSSGTPLASDRELGRLPSLRLWKLLGR